MTRVGTFALFNKIRFATQQSQNQVADLQIQASTGLKSQTYMGIARQVESMTVNENIFSRSKRYMDNIQVAQTRIDVMDSALQSIIDKTSAFRADLVSALNGDNFDQAPFNLQAEGLMSELANLFNTKLNGRYLFAGDATNTAPVDITAWGDPMPMPVDSDLVTTGFQVTDFALAIPANAVEYAEYYSYYNGDTGTQTVRADDNVTVDYTIRADSTGAAKLMYAMRLAATFNGAATDDEKRQRLDAALDTIQGAISDLINDRATLGVRGKQLEGMAEEHNTFSLMTQDIISEIQGVDIPQTISELTSYQTLMQSAFYVASRLPQNSLVQFLR